MPFAVGQRRSWLGFRSPTARASRVLLGFFTLALPLVWGPPACRQIVGVEDRLVGSCGLPLRQDPCGTCMQRECCAPQLACSERVTCTGFHECLARCDLADAACRSACMLDAEDFARGDEVTLCQAERCVGECASRCGGWEYRLQGCEACMQTKCCSEAAACAQSAGCRLVEDCLQSCSAGDWGCYVACRDQHDPAALALDDAFYNCFVAGCPVACGYGQVWSCVGKSEPVNASKSPISVALLFYDIPTNTWPAGATVKACLAHDPGCAAPAAVASTNAYGRADFLLDVEPAGFTGHFEVTANARMPVSVSFDPLLTGTPLTFLWYLIGETELISLAKNGVGVDLLPGRGHVMLALVDCAVAPATGLSVASDDPDAVPYYVGNSYFPTKNATATNSTGVAGFYNANPGPLAVEVREAASGTVVMRSEVVVGAGRISYAMLSPR